eukprot:767620-Hanusia_phi.AAC.1
MLGTMGVECGKGGVVSRQRSRLYQVIAFLKISRVPRTKKPLLQLGGTKGEVVQTNCSRTAAHCRAWSRFVSSDSRSVGANSKDSYFVSWDDRHPYSTVEAYRHCHKPVYMGKAKAMESLRGCKSVHWDERRPFATANIFRRSKLLSGTGDAAMN